MTSLPIFRSPKKLSAQPRWLDSAGLGKDAWGRVVTWPNEINSISRISRWTGPHGFWYAYDLPRTGWREHRLLHWVLLCISENPPRWTCPRRFRPVALCLTRSLGTARSVLDPWALRGVAVQRGGQMGMAALRIVTQLWPGRNMGHANWMIEVGGVAHDPLGYGDQWGNWGDLTPMRVLTVCSWIFVLMILSCHFKTPGRVLIPLDPQQKHLVFFVTCWLLLYRAMQCCIGSGTIVIPYGSSSQPTSTQVRGNEFCGSGNWLWIHRPSPSQSHMLHGWYIYLHNCLIFLGKCW